MSFSFALLIAGRKAFEKPCDILLLSFIPVAGCPKDMHTAQQYFLTGDIQGSSLQTSVTGCCSYPSDPQTSGNSKN